MRDYSGSLACEVDGDTSLDVLLRSYLTCRGARATDKPRGEGDETAAAPAVAVPAEAAKVDLAAEGAQLLRDYERVLAAAAVIEDDSDAEHTPERRQEPEPERWVEIEVDMARQPGRGGKRKRGLAPCPITSVGAASADSDDDDGGDDTERETKDASDDRVGVGANASAKTTGIPDDATSGRAADGADSAGSPFRRLLDGDKTLTRPHTQYLMRMTVADLQRVCAAYGLARSGRKKEVVERIRAHLKNA